MLYLTIVLAALLAAATIVQVVRTAILDERAEELDKREVYLDERANRIAAEEGALRTLYQSFKREFNAFRARDIYTASYTETDSDVMKYTTDALMEAHARKHLAATITNDIMKQFKVVEDRTEDGRRRFTYKFKIAEQ